MRAPYLMQSAVSFERRLPLKTTVAITYANAHGLHLLRSQDINAPLPGTYQSGGSGRRRVCRSADRVNFSLMESAGLYNQNQLIVNVNSKVNSNISLNLSYAYNRAMSNTDGIGTSQADPYSMAGEYGPAATDIHNRVALAGTITAKWGIRFNPLLTANTGPPFDITTGQDNYGDGLFNARPAIATDPDDARRGRDQIRSARPESNARRAASIPQFQENAKAGPGSCLNMRVGRTFAFGPPREGGAPSSGGGPGGSPGGGSAPGSRGAPSSPFSMGGGGQSSGAISDRPSLPPYDLNADAQLDQPQ